MSNSISSFFTKIGDFSSDIVQRYLPDAFIFALLLTFLTMVLAVVFTSKGVFDVARHWSQGFWFVLKFSMQSSLALITGWILADSPPVKRVLNKFAELPSNQIQAIFLTAVVGQLLGLFHWGVVLIGSAIFARNVGIEMEKKDVSVHYPLLVATGYAGLLPWHQGLSAAAPLLVATEGHFLSNLIGIIPVSETIFHPVNIVIALGVVILSIIVMPLMAPNKKENIISVSKSKLEEAKIRSRDEAHSEHKKRESRFKSLLLDSKILAISAGGLVWSYLLYLFLTNPFMEVFNLNIFISILFGSGLVLHGNLRNYIDVLRDALEGASQIIIQFQFYGGIMGIMAWSGLGTLIAQTAADLATSNTWYFFAFLASGIVNFFVPSGGGQWVVTGKVLAEATQVIAGADMNLMIIAFGVGDQWTNMIQPFWAIPVISIAGLSIRDIMGYCVILFVFSGVLFAIGVLLMGVLL